MSKSDIESRVEAIEKLDTEHRFGILVDSFLRLENQVKKLTKDRRMDALLATIQTPRCGFFKTMEESMKCTMNGVDDTDCDGNLRKCTKSGGENE